MGLDTPDVAVIGAGIIGLSIARRLARGGARVSVVDAGGVGQGASWAAAGMLAVGGEFFRDEPLFRLAKAAIRLWPEFARELESETGVAVDYVECGAIERPCAETPWSSLQDRACRQQKLGIVCEIADNEVFFPEDSIVDPRHVLTALRRACAGQVDIRENQAVRSIDAAGVPAVIAAGCWSNAIQVLRGGEPVRLPGVRPVKGHLIGYQLVPGTVPHILRCGHTYLLQRSNGFTIAGSTMEDAGFDTTVRSETCRELHERACALLPLLRAQSPAECWTGLRPGAEEPVIGRLPGTNVWLAYGHYRNGILLAPITAEIVSSEIIASLGRG